MKKIIKRIFFVLLLAFIVWYIYRVGLFLYAYNVIDKGIQEKLSTDYSIKLIFDEKRMIQNWKSDKYCKTGIFVKSEDQLDFTEVYDSWYDVDNKIKITEQNDNKLEISYDANYMNMLFTPFSNSENMFTTSYSFTYLVDTWRNIGEGGLLYALITTFVQPIMTVNSIKTEEIGGKEYYVVTSKYSFDYATKKYVDKETMLPFRIENIQPGITTMTNYEFSFEPITKESLGFPNIDEYYVVMN